MIDLTFDTETEGLGLGTDRAWQLAFQAVENGRVIDKQNMYVDLDNFEISEGAARVTKFDRAKYDREKKPILSVLLKFEDYALEDDCRIIAHNGLGFDIYMLGNLYREIGRKFKFTDYVYKFRDTLAMARAEHFQSPPPKDKYDFLAWQYKHLAKYDKSVKTSLAALAKKHNIEVDETKTHDALYDVELNYNIYKRLAYSIDL